MRIPVQYAAAADGARIAYATHGDGLPVVYMPPLPLRHVELEWSLPEDRRWLERLGRGRLLISYDPRGLGLSDRRMHDWSLDAFVDDVVAVVDALGLERVALFAGMNSAAIAIAYAARYPERVSHLVLWCAVARVADAFSPQLAMLLELAEKDWQLFTEAAAHQMVGWSAGEAANRYAAYLRACLEPATARSLLAALPRIDVTGVLPAVRVPTLVLHRRGIESQPIARATELASAIPGARLTLLDGDVIRPGVGDMESAASAVDEFLGDVEPGARPMREDARAADASPRHGDATEQPVFRREGDFWTLAFAGRVARLRDVKGLHHLARLMRVPGEVLAPAELIAELDPPAPGAGLVAPREGLRSGDLGDAGPLLDGFAKASYRERLADLRRELDDAERCNDPARIEAARGEIEFLTGELTAAIGLGGRDRKAASAAERARLTVTKRIRDALARIDAHHPELAHHLTATIKTGRLCVYRPEPDGTPAWTF